LLRRLHIRNAQTHLGPERFNPLPDSRLQTLFGPSFSEVDVVIDASRYNHYAHVLLRAAEWSEPKPRHRLIEMARQGLVAYDRYGRDSGDGNYYAMLDIHTGRRLGPSDWVLPIRPHRYRADAFYRPRDSRFLAGYYQALCKANAPASPAIMVILDRLQRMLGLDDGGNAELLCDGEAAASAIHGLLNRYHNTDQKKYLVQAMNIARAAVRTLWQDGFLKRRSDDKLWWMNQRLPLAMLRLIVIVKNLPIKLPDDVNGDPGKFVVREL
jgi:hypothetical protein